MEYTPSDHEDQGLGDASAAKEPATETLVNEEGKPCEETSAPDDSLKEETAIAPLELSKAATSNDDPHTELVDDDTHAKAEHGGNINEDVISESCSNEKCFPDSSCSDPLSSDGALDDLGSSPEDISRNSGRTHRPEVNCALESTKKVNAGVPLDDGEDAPREEGSATTSHPTDLLESPTRQFPLEVPSKLSYNLKTKDQLEQGDGKRSKRLSMTNFDLMDKADGISPSASSSRSRCVSLMPSIEEGIEEDKGSSDMPQSTSASSSCSSLESSPSLRSHHEAVTRVSSKPTLTSISEELVYKPNALHVLWDGEVSGRRGGELTCGDTSSKGQADQSIGTLRQGDGDVVPGEAKAEPKEELGCLGGAHCQQISDFSDVLDYLMENDLDLPGWVIIEKHGNLFAPQQDHEIIAQACFAQERTQEHGDSGAIDGAEEDQGKEKGFKGHAAADETESDVAQEVTETSVLQGAGGFNTAPQNNTPGPDSGCERNEVYPFPDLKDNPSDPSDCSPGGDFHSEESRRETPHSVGEALLDGPDKRCSHDATQAYSEADAYMPDEKKRNSRTNHTQGVTNKQDEDAISTQPSDVSNAPQDTVSFGSAKLKGSGSDSVVTDNTVGGSDPAIPRESHSEHTSSLGTSDKSDKDKENPKQRCDKEKDRDSRDSAGKRKREQRDRTVEDGERKGCLKNARGDVRRMTIEHAVCEVTVSELRGQDMKVPCRLQSQLADSTDTSIHSDHSCPPFNLEVLSGMEYSGSDATREGDTGNELTKQPNRLSKRKSPRKQMPEDVAGATPNDEEELDDSQMSEKAEPSSDAIDPHDISVQESNISESINQSVHSHGDTLHWDMSISDSLASSQPESLKTLIHLKMVPARHVKDTSFNHLLSQHSEEHQDHTPAPGESSSFDEDSSGHLAVAQSNSIQNSLELPVTANDVNVEEDFSDISAPELSTAEDVNVTTSKARQQKDLPLNEDGIPHAQDGSLFSTEVDDNMEVEQISNTGCASTETAIQNGENEKSNAESGTEADLIPWSTNRDLVKKDDGMLNVELEHGGDFKEDVEEMHKEPALEREEMGDCLADDADSVQHKTCDDSWEHNGEVNVAIGYSDTNEDVGNICLETDALDQDIRAGETKAFDHDTPSHGLDIPQSGRSMAESERCDENADQSDIYQKKTEFMSTDMDGPENLDSQCDNLVTKDDPKHAFVTDADEAGSPDVSLTMSSEDSQELQTAIKCSEQEIFHIEIDGFGLDKEAKCDDGTHVQTIDEDIHEEEKTELTPIDQDELSHGNKSEEDCIERINNSNPNEIVHEERAHKNESDYGKMVTKVHAADEAGRPEPCEPCEQEPKSDNSCGVGDVSQQFEDHIGEGASESCQIGRHELDNGEEVSQNSEEKIVVEKDQKVRYVVQGKEKEVELTPETFPSQSEYRPGNVVECVDAQENGEHNYAHEKVDDTDLINKEIDSSSGDEIRVEEALTEIKDKIDAEQGEEEMYDPTECGRENISAVQQQQEKNDLPRSESSGENIQLQSNEERIASEEAENEHIPQEPQTDVELSHVVNPDGDSELEQNHTDSECIYKVNLENKEMYQQNDWTPESACTSSKETSVLQSDSQSEEVHELRHSVERISLMFEDMTDNKDEEGTGVADNDTKFEIETKTFNEMKDEEWFKQDENETETMHEGLDEGSHLDDAKDGHNIHRPDGQPEDSHESNISSRNESVEMEMKQKDVEGQSSEERPCQQPEDEKIIESSFDADGEMPQRLGSIGLSEQTPVEEDVIIGNVSLHSEITTNDTHTEDVDDEEMSDSVREEKLKNMLQKSDNESFSITEVPRSFYAALEEPVQGASMDNEEIALGLSEENARAGNSSAPSREQEELPPATIASMYVEMLKEQVGVLTSRCLQSTIIDNSSQASSSKVGNHEACSSSGGESNSCPDAIKLQSLIKYELGKDGDDLQEMSAGTNNIPDVLENDNMEITSTTDKRVELDDHDTLNISVHPTVSATFVDECSDQSDQLTADAHLQPRADVMSHNDTTPESPNNPSSDFKTETGTHDDDDANNVMKECCQETPLDTENIHIDLPNVEKEEVSLKNEGSSSCSESISQPLIELLKKRHDGYEKAGEEEREQLLTDPSQAEESEESEGADLEGELAGSVNETEMTSDTAKEKLLLTTDSVPNAKLLLEHADIEENKMDLGAVLSDHPENGGALAFNGPDVPIYKSCYQIQLSGCENEMEESEQMPNLKSEATEGQCGQLMGASFDGEAIIKEDRTSEPFNSREKEDNDATMSRSGCGEYFQSPTSHMEENGVCCVDNAMKELFTVEQAGWEFVEVRDVEHDTTPTEAAKPCGEEESSRLNIDLEESQITHALIDVNNKDEHCILEVESKKEDVDSIPPKDEQAQRKDEQPDDELGEHVAVAIVNDIVDLVPGSVEGGQEEEVHSRLEQNAEARGIADNTSPEAEAHSRPDHSTPTHETPHGSADRKARHRILQLKCPERSADDVRIFNKEAFVADKKGSKSCSYLDNVEIVIDEAIADKDDADEAPGPSEIPEQQTLEVDASAFLHNLEGAAPKSHTLPPIGGASRRRRRKKAATLDTLRKKEEQNLKKDSLWERVKAMLRQPLMTSRSSNVDSGQVSISPRVHTLATEASASPTAQSSMNREQADNASSLAPFSRAPTPGRHRLRHKSNGSRNQVRKFQKLRNLRRGAEYMSPDKQPGMRRHVFNRRTWQAQEEISRQSTQPDKKEKSPGPDITEIVPEQTEKKRKPMNTSTEVFEVSCEQPNWSGKPISQTLVSKETSPMQLLMQPLMSGMKSEQNLEQKEDEENPLASPPETAPPPRKTSAPKTISPPKRDSLTRLNSPTTINSPTMVDFQTRGKIRGKTRGKSPTKGNSPIKGKSPRQESPPIKEISPKKGNSPRRGSTSRQASPPNKSSRTRELISESSTPKTRPSKKMACALM